MIYILAALFLVAWLALYLLVIRPKLAAFRYTAGIYARLDQWEAGFWPKLGLIFKGIKVAIVGFVTSAAPVAVVFYDKITGFDWTQFVPSERARMIAGGVALLGILGPMIMVALHQGAIADAAAVEPKK